MATFASLPVELRLEIWNLALHQEAHDRLLIISQTSNIPITNETPLCLLPLKHHASPLLSVNSESRGEAKAFYTVKLDVYEVPRLSKEDITSRNKCSCQAQYINKIVENASVVKGSIYLSPQYDFFVSVRGVDTLPYLQEDKKTVVDKKEEQQQQEEEEKENQEKNSRYITARIPAEVAAQVRNVVCVQKNLDRDDDFYDWWWTDTYMDNLLYNREELVRFLWVPPYRPRLYGPVYVRYLWRASDFKHIQNYLHLWLPQDELDGFVDGVVRNRGRGEYSFRKWQLDPANRIPKLVLLDLDNMPRKEDGEDCAQIEKLAKMIR
ncbi:uncharacterized protein F4812DRAFT_279989 [Daldinia caldariorum]|uniref:uncharacterized protein n=1 Tax=Daldinia caldariorum TaxID=326644 RepID=UPI0020077FEE|nr:uncharacterized protein F4812DRAFT_279989 [Daldinia caldariorum]KAI1470818.1 hypothetical protein F4812DRAFT_279989 [Daldinia caldariorum]